MPYMFKYDNASKFYIMIDVGTIIMKTIRYVQGYIRIFAKQFIRMSIEYFTYTMIVEYNMKIFNYKTMSCRHKYAIIFNNYHLKYKIHFPFLNRHYTITR